MARGFQAESSLSVHRAFVVHFGTGGGPRRHRFHGRVEHLSSGRTAKFSSLEQLLGFVTMILDSSGPAAPRSPIDRKRTNTTPAGAPSSRRRGGRTGALGSPR
jgi:hypothetical protein